MIWMKAHEVSTVTPASAMCAPLLKPCMSLTTASSPPIAARLAIVAMTTSARIVQLPVVLQLGAVPHVVARRADHHDRGEQHIETGAGFQANSQRVTGWRATLLGKSRPTATPTITAMNRRGRA